MLMLKNKTDSQLLISHIVQFSDRGQGSQWFFRNLLAGISTCKAQGMVCLRSCMSYKLQVQEHFHHRKSMSDFHNYCMFVEGVKRRADSELLINRRQRELAMCPRQHIDRGQDVLIPQEAQVIITTNVLARNSSYSVPCYMSSNHHIYMSTCLWSDRHPVIGGSKIAAGALTLSEMS